MKKYIYIAIGDLIQPVGAAQIKPLTLLSHPVTQMAFSFVT